MTHPRLKRSHPHGDTVGTMTTTTTTKPRKSRQEQFEDERRDYYRRLDYKLRKDLRKSIKVATRHARQRQQDNLSSIDPDAVLHECVRRLGFHTLNPDTVTPIPRCESQWIEQLVDSKPVQAQLRIWDQEITTFRRWSLQQSERRDKKSEVIVPKKKNRPGQRARRAKAQALEAKQTGKPYQSHNWRKKSTNMHTANELDRTTTKTQDTPQNDTRQDEPPLHPSWQAAKQNRNVEFKGQKITFT